MRERATDHAAGIRIETSSQVEGERATPAVESASGREHGRRPRRETRIFGRWDELPDSR